VPRRKRNFWLSIRAGQEDNAAACLLYDWLATFLSAATYERIRDPLARLPSEELPRHRHSARQRVDASVPALIELLPCRA
jgi:hypothetical protein